MFDLFRSQAKATRYLLIVLLSLVALSMVVTLIPGFGGSFGGASPQMVLAQVGDTPITAMMLQKLLQNQIRAGQFPRSLAETIVPQYVSQLVNEYATSYEAERLGFTVTDQEVINGIRTVVPQLFQNGQFVGTEAYQDYLMQMNMTIPEFEAAIRQQVLLSKMQNLIFGGMVVTPQEVEAEFARRSEKVKLDVVVFDPNVLQAQIKPSREEMEAYLKSHQQAFQTPVKRTMDLLIVDADSLGKSVPITEAQLRAAYNADLSRFSEPEKIHIRHILLQTEDKSPEEVAKIKEKAESLLKQIKAGADFAKLAKENSDDPISAAKGGDLDWVVRGQTMPEFENAAFALKPNQISDVVQSVYGFHIIQMLERQAPRVKPFEEVRGELESELKKQQLFDKMPAVADQARTELLKTPDQAAQIAQKLGITAIHVQDLPNGSPIPQLGTSTEVENAVSGLAKGGVSQVIQLEDKLVVAVVTDITPPHPATLAEVETRVRDAVANAKALRQVSEKAQEFENRLRANHNDLRKTAQEMGVKVITTNDFERNGQMEGVGTAAFFGDKPFTLAVGQAVRMNVATTPYFFKILSHTPGDPSKLPEMRDAIVTALKDAKMRQRRDLFEEGLVRRLTEQGKVKINQDAIKQFITTYSS